MINIVIMDITKSLLSREQSLWLKGVLILLIVLGHDGILMGKYEGMEKIPLNDYLYSFHVYAFFFVTSLYNWRPLDKVALKRNFLRCYKPFLTMFFLTLILNVIVMGGQIPNVMDVVLALVTGSDILIKKATGLSFLWFLPTMFVFVLLLKIMARKGCGKLKFVIISIASLIWLSTIAGFWDYEDSSYWSISGSWAALRTFGLCLICRLLFESFASKPFYKVCIMLSFIGATLLYFVFYKYDRTFTYLMEYGILPFIAFQFLGVCAYLKKGYSRLMLYLGRHSLNIYLIHLLVYNVLVVIIRYFSFKPTIFVGLLVYFATLSLTLLFDFVFKSICSKGYFWLYSR